MAETVAETERLRLRTWDFADRAEFNRHLNVPTVMRTSCSAPPRW